MVKKPGLSRMATPRAAQPPAKSPQSGWLLPEALAAPLTNA
jgi:hypothetical protein